MSTMRHELKVLGYLPEQNITAPGVQYECVYRQVCWFRRSDRILTNPGPTDLFCVVVCSGRFTAS